MNKLINFWYNTFEGNNMHYVCHYLMGFFLTVVLSSFIDLQWSILIVVFIAILKEVMDKYSGKGCPDALAAIITIFGVISAYLVETIK